MPVFQRKRFLSIALVFIVTIVMGVQEKNALSKKRQGRALKKRFRKRPIQSMSRSNVKKRNLTEFEKFEKAIKDTLSGRWLGESDTAVVVSNAKTGKEILAINPDLQLNPASNIKLVSTASALSQLDPSWRYETSFYGGLPGKDGVVKNGIYLKGDWDPLFGINNLRKLAKELRASGIKKIDGDIWMSDTNTRDQINSLVRIEIKTPKTPKGTPQVSVWPKTDFIVVKSDIKYVKKRKKRKRVRTGVSMNAEWRDIEGQKKLVVTVTGTAKLKRRYKLRKGFKDDPMVSAMMIKEAIVSAGIVHHQGLKFGTFDSFVEDNQSLPLPLAMHKSKPIKELVAMINKWSINWLADALIRTTSRQQSGGEPTMDGGIEIMNQWMSGLGVSEDNFIIDTGSGLSYNSKMTARQIVKVLRRASGYESVDDLQFSHQTFQESLAIGGEDGTLKKRFKNEDEEPTVFGKTGTLTKIIALSGVLKRPGTSDLVFSIITNGSNHRHRNDVRRDHENIVRFIQAHQSKFYKLEKKLAFDNKR